MHGIPKAASTTPPSGRDPVAAAAANPPISPAAASAAVRGRRDMAGMLPARRLSSPVVDEGLPIAYEVLDKGVPVYTADGTSVGTVDHVVAAPQVDIFHGLVIRTAEGRRFVPADQVRELHEHGVDLRIGADDVAGLPEPHGAVPDLEVRDPTSRTSRGKWKEILHMVEGKGYLDADWSDEK